MAGPVGNAKGQGGQNSQQPMSGAVSTTPKKANTAATMPGEGMVQPQGRQPVQGLKGDNHLADDHPNLYQGWGLGSLPR